MTEETQTTFLTYTLRQNGGTYNSSTVSLNISLPSTTSPFVLIAKYDISQIIDGQPRNAILIFMKKTVDNGDDLPAMSSSTTNFSFPIGSLIPNTSGANYTPFSSALDETLVIIFHDAYPTSTSLSTDVTHFHGRIKEIRKKITDNNGNPLTEDHSVIPRKAGMSLIRK